MHADLATNTEITEILISLKHNYLGLSPYGFIEQLNYDNSVCKTWEICSTCSEVQVNVLHLDTQDRKDFLYIGGNFYSGSHKPFQLTLGAETIIGFQSDDRNTSGGFKILWQCPYQGIIVFCIFFKTVYEVFWYSIFW